MQYILTTGWEDGIADLTKRLTQELATGKNVLWLTSGGSNVSATVQVMSNITDEYSKQLSIMLADERYGDVGHAESNWEQLMQAGLDAKKAQLLPTLINGRNFEKTVKHYQQLAAWAFADADVVIAQLGIGSDGHIAGILPFSVAANESTELVTGYESTPYKRLTLTFLALEQVTVAYAFAFGDSKQQALQTLYKQELTVQEQPAQMLKKLPEAYLYSDQIGDTV